MSCRNREFQLSLAEEKDGKELLEIYEKIEFNGSISVIYTRRDDAYRSLNMEGERAVIPVVRDMKNGKICGVGACILRSVYIDGEIKKAGYLTGIKILPEYRGKILNIAEAYRMIYEELKEETEIFYTTILEENSAVRKLLEKKRKSMPEYRFEDNYTVYCLTTGLKKKSRDNSEIVWKKGTDEKLIKFYNENMKKMDFAPSNIHNTADKNEFYYAEDRNGNITGAFALWSQQEYKQYIVAEYRGIYRLLSKIKCSLFGYPDFPKEKTVVNYGTVSYLCVADGNEKIYDEIIKKAVESGKNYDFIMIGAAEETKLNRAVKKFKSVKYRSRVYSVHFGEVKEYSRNGRELNIDVGML